MRLSAESRYIQWMRFLARQFEFRFPRPAIVMGIVNVTPDSFSDGGKFFDPQRAVAHALELAGQGAEILDVGGESTRPGARPVSEKEELRRVIPVIEKLVEIFHDISVRPDAHKLLPLSSPKEERAGVRRPTKIPSPQPSPRFGGEREPSIGLAKRQLPFRPLISIDTMKPAVARAALAAGASIVNDVAANRAGEAMWKIVAGTKAGYICMHAQGTPQTMQKHPQYRNVVRDVEKFFRERLKKLKAAGVSPDQVVFDPGIGFGKSLEHNLRLLAALKTFQALKRPLLLGVSRKSFIEKFCGAGLNERLPAALSCATLAVGDGVQIIRTHDVPETLQAIRLAEAVLSRK